MLRGSRNFGCRKEYKAFLRALLKQLNSSRQERFLEEQAVLRSLPARRLESCSRFTVRVGPGSTIRIKHNVYSVHSRLIKEQVTVRLYSEHLEVWYGQRCIEHIPRLHDSGNHHIQHRHIIDWLDIMFLVKWYKRDLTSLPTWVRMRVNTFIQSHNQGGRS